MDKKIAIQASQIRHMYSTSNITQITSVILAAILSYILRSVIDPAIVLGWFCLIVLVAFSRTVLAIFFRRSADAVLNATHFWLRNFRIGVFSSGAAWGSVSLLLFPSNHIQHQAFIAAILCGLSAGGLTSYSADLLSGIVYVASVLVPLIIRMFYEGDSLSFAMGMALLLYLCFMVMSVRYMNRNISENISMRLEAAEREVMVRVSEQRYRLLLNHSPVGIFHFDASLIISYCNNRFAEILHNSADRLIGLDMNTIKDQSILPALRMATEGSLGYYEGRYIATFSDADGWVAMTCAPSLDSEGKITGGVAIVQDITERKQTDAALHESHQKMFSLLNSMAEGAYGVDIYGNCTFVNRSFLRILGYENADEIIGKSIHALIHHSHPDGSVYPDSECKMSSAYRHHREVHVSDEVFWKKDGVALPVEYWSQPIIVDGVMQGAVATFIDITERKLAEAHIHNLAYYDALTQLPNRRLLNDRLGQAIASSKRSGRLGALMFLDLDNFKPLNDTHGHGVGDLLLIEAAHRISRCIRETDTAARFGGDEFVVMLSELHEDQAESTAQASIVAEKIRAILSEPYRLTIQLDGKADNTVEHHCTSSIGVVIFNYHAIREDILKSADMAMYQAKESGRDRVIIGALDKSNQLAADQGAIRLRLNWLESYVCGEPIIDQEHRKLFDLANILIESIFTRDENPQGFDSALEKLIEHVVKHFADEEAILARYGYNDLEVHALSHVALMDHARQLVSKAAMGSVTVGELVNFLADELVAQHMLKADRKFYPLFKRVTHIVDEISAASTEQRKDIEKVNIAITQLDDATQQNAALVEQVAAASESMEVQAQKLAAVAAFKVDQSENYPIRIR